MPAQSVHLAKASHNREFLTRIDASKPEDLDWAVVVAFYRLLHLVEAWFARNMNGHNHNHGERNRAVSTHLATINVSYLRLYNRARLARYEAFSMSPAQYAHLSRDDIAPVEAHLVEALRRS